MVKWVKILLTDETQRAIRSRATFSVSIPFQRESSFFRRPPRQNATNHRPSSFVVTAASLPFSLCDLSCMCVFVCFTVADKSQPNKHNFFAVFLNEAKKLAEWWTCSLGLGWRLRVQCWPTPLMESLKNGCQCVGHLSLTCHNWGGSRTARGLAITALGSG